MRTILVTGATGGIGVAVCKRLAQSGLRLVLASRDAKKLQELSRELPATTAGAHDWISIDMASDESVSRFAVELASRNVSLDGVVLMPPQPHRSDDPLPDSDAWRALFQQSFIGPLALLKAAIAAMSPDPVKNRRAKIVIISGVSSVQVLGHYATSNVIRCAWVGEAKTLAFALGERGIHVNTLSLGGTLSPWYRDAIERRARAAGVSFHERLAEETSNIPLKKYGEPDEVAKVVEGLLSEFSDHMTGLNILHDGGFTRAY